MASNAHRVQPGCFLTLHCRLAGPSDRPLAGRPVTFEVLVIGVP